MELRNSQRHTQLSSPYQAGDKTVNGAVSGTSQRTMGFNNNSMTNADTLNGDFITYTPRDPKYWGYAGGSKNPEALVNRTGLVDMDKYVAWLRHEDRGYVFAN